MDDEEHIVDLELSKVTFVKTGPRLVDLAVDSVDRNNLVSSHFVDRVTWKGSDREFTERKGIQDFIDFMNIVVDTARNNGDNDTLENVQLFRDNVRFIGENELKDAVNGIAMHLIEVASSGQHVVVHHGNDRSERYISQRIIEVVDRLTESNPELRSRFRISGSVGKIAQFYNECGGSLHIAVVDDFAVSGNRIRDFSTNAYAELVRVGIPKVKVLSAIEATLVAMPLRPGGSNINLRTTEEDYPLKSYAYFSIPEYQNNANQWVTHPGVSYSGSHTSVDYGFDMQIEYFDRYLKDKGVSRVTPLLHKINSPYEMEGYTKKYKDPDLQKRWENVVANYSL